MYKHLETLSDRTPDEMWTKDWDLTVQYRERNHLLPKLSKLNSNSVVLESILHMATDSHAMTCQMGIGNNAGAWTMETATTSAMTPLLASGSGPIGMSEILRLITLISPVLKPMEDCTLLPASESEESTFPRPLQYSMRAHQFIQEMTITRWDLLLTATMIMTITWLSQTKASTVWRQTITDLDKATTISHRSLSTV